METKPTTEMNYDELVEHNRYVRLLAETLEMEEIIKRHTEKKTPRTKSTKPEEPKANE
jgi:hypothetical protein